MITKETPIILTTEKVTYESMSEREKQIYDEAYARGVDNEKELASFPSKKECFIMGMILGFIIGIFFLSTNPFNSYP